MQIKTYFFVKNRIYSIILNDMSMWELAHRHARSDFCKIYIVHFCPIVGTTFNVHSPTCHAVLS